MAPVSFTAETKREGHAVHLPLSAQDVIFFTGRSFYTDSPSVRGPMGWIFCGQHIKQVVQYLYKVECRGD